MTTNITNRRFIIYTVVIIVVWIIVFATATGNHIDIQESPESEKANTRLCKDLCDSCNCLAFYCGEECICECNHEKSDTECIAGMQQQARKHHTAFEILIQGPTANSFVRNALQFEQNSKRHSQNTCHHRRSSVTIFKPQVVPNSIYSLSENKVKNKQSIISEKRLKRSTNSQFEWFQDNSNTLVRPAPLGLKPKKTEETKTTTLNPERASTHQSVDKSWFSDSSPNILTPKPLVKKSFKIINNEDYKDSIQDSSVKPIFPPLEEMQSFGKEIVNALGVSRTINNENENIENNNNNNNKNMFDSDNDSLLTNIFKKDKIKIFRINNEDLEKHFSLFKKGGPQKTKMDTVDSNNSKSVEESQEEQPEKKEQKKVPKKATNVAIRRKLFNNNAVPDFRIPWLRPVNFFKNFQQSLVT